MVACLLLAAAASAQRIAPPDESRTIGTRVPAVTLTDHSGAPLPFDSFAGKPTIVNPVFTSCPHICPAITSGLHEAIAPIGEPGVDYNVITVTFDPADTIAELEAYRERLGLPDGWVLALGPGGPADSLLRALDFRYAPAPGGGFAHPNVIAILTPELAVSGYIHGLIYEEDDFRAALARASGLSLLDRAKPMVALVALGGVLVVLAVLGVTRLRGTAG